MTSRKQKVEDLIADFQLLRKQVAFRTHGSERLIRVTTSQWGVLMFIEQHGTSAVKEVAKALSITSSAATQLIDSLVDGKYLTRGTSAEDRRTVTLTLSKKSRGQIARMKKGFLERLLKLFEVLSDVEFDQYLALNKKIVRGILSAKKL